jgi:hypothetical protein
MQVKWNAAAVVIGAMVSLAACQTPYQEMGYEGGVAAVPITNNTYRISARGNGFTDPTTVQDYVLLKAAEVTLASGNSYFTIVNNRDATSSSVGQTAGTFQTSVIGNTAFTTYNPGMTYNIVKPGEDLLIQVSTSAMPGAFPAQEVFNNINPRVQRSK